MELLAKTIGFLAPYEFSPAVLVACAGTAWLYHGGRRAERTPHRAMLFWVGLLLIYGVLQSHYDFYAQHMFFLHRLQHLILHHLAPLLIVLALPGGRLRAGAPPLLRKHLFDPLLHSRLLHSTMTLIQQPVMAGALFVGLIYFWLIPDVHFIAMLNLPLYNAMNWGMAIDGLLFWWMVFNMRREGSSAAYHFGGRILLLFLVMIPQIVIGAAIALSGQELFEVYAVCGRVWPLSAHVDQQLGGLITWIPAAMMSVAGALLLMQRWLREQGLATAGGARCRELT